MFQVSVSYCRFRMDSEVRYVKIRDADRRSAHSHTLLGLIGAPCLGDP